MSKPSEVRVTMPVETDELETDIVSGEGFVPTTVWWDVSEVGLSVSAFSADNKKIRTWNEWSERSSIEEVPDWVPNPPPWFDKAVDDVMKEEA